MHRLNHTVYEQRSVGLYALMNLRIYLSETEGYDHLVLVHAN